MLKKRLFYGVGLIICTAAVVGLIIFYSLFTSSHIFSESVSHLDEIYSQVNVAFSAVVERNHNILDGWTDYIEEKAGSDTEEDDTALTDYINARRAGWGFTNFYFLNEYGEGRLVVPETDENGNITEMRELGIPAENLDELKSGSATVASGVRNDDGKRITLFAIPATKMPDGSLRQYKGFEYYAMGLTFDNEAMIKTLSIAAFSQSGSCYVTDSNGNIVMSTDDHFEGYGEENGGEQNFLAHLKEYGQEYGRASINVYDDNGDAVYDENGVAKKTVYGQSSYDQIAASVLNGQSGINLVKIHGIEKYLIYQPIGFYDWMLVSVVPSIVINESMNSFRVVTICIMAGIFVLLAAAVTGFVLVVSRRHVQAKELELKSRENLFDLLTKNTNEIFVLFSPENFKSDYISPNLERVLGVDAELVRNDVRNILSASIDKIPAFTAEGLEKLEKESTWVNDVHMRSVTSGEIYWFKLMLYRSSFGGKSSFVMMLSDRTKEQSMNEHLEQLLDVAKAANSAKSNFLSNMSHDIRTPMNAIIGFATLIAKDADKPDKVLEYVRKISYSSHHLLGLINDILDMSKIESGKTTLNMEEFSLSTLLEELYSIMGPQAKAKRQTFEMHTKGNLPEVVLGDKLRLNQILINLISNAVKYTQEEGTIMVGVEAMSQNVHNHAHLKFTVQDNGLGMTEEFVNTIFEPFTREQTNATKSIQGTGLGMAITKNIVDLMGGTITVQSELGKGSTFSVELELATVELEEDEDFWNKHNITRALVVDDEEQICLDVKELMDGTGVEISYATDGYKAVDMVNEACDKNEDYHIVLLDWKMPGLNGVETAKLIRKKVGDSVPILVLTSYDFAEIEEEAKASGIDFFLPKPFFVSNFRRAVSQIKDLSKDEPTAVSSDVSLEGLKILAAEDNEINAEILVDLLEMEGIECEVMPNGKEAVEKFTNSKPGTYDLILMDVQMPVMNGYEATRAIRASKHQEAKSIPILAMTANAFDDDVKAALDAGMNAHMSKPIDIEKMKAMIAELKRKN